MGKRLLLVVLLAASLACTGTGKKQQQSAMTMSARASAGAVSRDAVERALAQLGIDARILRLDLNEGRSRKHRVHIQKVHVASDMLLLESAGPEPTLFALDRDGLDPRWVSNLKEPTAFPIGESGDMLVLVSRHYAHVLERMSGRRALQFIGGALDGLRRPPLELPMTPTGGAAVGNDTFYIPSLGNPDNNKTLESFSGVTGQRGWGYRTAGEVLTTPLVGGGSGDPKLYFMTTSGLVTCMDATNYAFPPEGTRWEQLLEAGVKQPMFLTADTKARAGSLFLVDEEGVVYCLNRITGARRWVHATGLRAAGMPRVFGDLCVVEMSDGMMAFDRANVVYGIEVAGGPDKGRSFWVRGAQPKGLGNGAGADLVLSDRALAAVQINFELQGEVLLANAASEELSFRVDGGKPVTRAVLHGGSRIRAGNTELVIRDHGSAPLWSGVAVDRIVARVGDTLIAVKQGKLVALDAGTGEASGDPVALPGARLIPTNTTDANLFVLAGDARVYGLFSR